MVLDDRGHGAREGGGGEGLSRLQQEGLVEMVRVGEGLVEEPTLDRRERHLALHRSLLGRGEAGGTGGIGGIGSIRGGGVAGELGHGRVVENLPRGEAQTGLTGPGHDLDGEDRIAAELEEVVVH